MARNGIVIAAGSKMIRRIVIDHDDPASHAGEGETVILVGRAPSLEEAVAAVIDTTGVTPPDPRCVVIDEKGEVVDVKMLDPELDAAAFPGKTLKLHSEADRGWVYDSGKDELSRKDADVVEIAVERER